MTSNEKSIITALNNGKLVNINLKSGCVLKNVSGAEFADVLVKTLDPDGRFNVYNAAAFYACSLLKVRYSALSNRITALPPATFLRMILRCLTLSLRNIPPEWSQP